MLRYSICIVFVISLALADEIVSREKRQSRGFRIIGKDTFFVLDGEETVQLTGGRSRPDPIELTAADDVTCNTDTREITSSGRVFSPAITDINECTFVEADSTIVRVTNGERNFIGPGQLYIGSTRALFLDTSVEGTLPSLIFNQIESSRSFFPAVIPPLEILYVRMGDNDLVVNLDNDGDEDGVAQNGDNTLVFTGSRCRQVESTDFFTYLGDRIDIRRGLQLLDTIEDIGRLVQINQRIVNGVPCDELIQSDGSATGAVAGPGLLCIGQDALDTSSTLALFSNSESATRQITSEGSGRQIEGVVNNGVASLVGGGNISRIAGQTLVTQTGAQNIELPRAGFIDKFQGRVRVFDEEQQLVEQFECGDPAGISFSRSLNNTIVRAPQSNPNLMRVPVEPNGLSAIFNPSMCELFTYQQMNFAIREIAAENLARAPTPRPDPIRFSIRSEDFGANFYADDSLVFRPSSSEILSLGSDERIVYRSNQINLLDNIGNAGTIGGINQLSILTGLNMLSTFNGSTNIVPSGPGTLYADAEGRAFFTANSAVNNLIMNSLSRISGGRRVSVSGVRDATGATSISFTTGGQSFFSYGTDVMSMTVTGTQGYVYRNQNISRVNAIRVPSGGSVAYIAPLNQVQITPGDGGMVMTITGVGMGNGFWVANTPFGTVSRISSNRTYPGGGVFYTGSMGHMYLPSMVISEGAFMTLNTIGGLTNTSNQGISSLSFFGNDGDFQMYTGSSRVLLPGMGTLYRSGDQAFFTNNQVFNQNLGGQISTFRPVDVGYTRETGMVVITSTGGRTFSFSIGSQRFDRLAAGGTITFSGGNITTSAATGNFVGGDIDTLTTFNGIEFITFGSGDEIELPGGGILFIDPETGMAFYTTDTITTRRVTTTVSNIISSFVAPSFPSRGVASVTSKLREVAANFGQIVTVYDGADVDLLCDAGNANPPAAFSFGFLDSNDPDNNESFVGVTESETLMIVADGPNRRILRLINVTEGSLDYQCSATSAGNVARVVSRVNVRPREDPAIVNSFFPGIPGENEVRVNVQNTPRRLMPIPTIRPNTPTTVIADESLLTDVVTIGCKAEGRPKARIRWLENGAPVDLTSPDRNETIPRQGQSFLSVVLPQGSTACTTYTCEAENGGGVVTGEIEICPQRFETEATNPIVTRECSATECGVGVEERSYLYQRFFEGLQQPGVLNFTALPAGLVKPLLYICVNPNMPVCPAMEYTFETSDFGECDAFCGRGNQTRDVDCVRNGNMTVDDMECTSRGLTRPRAFMGCDNGPCPRYGTEAFTPCSQTCRGGTRIRRVFCLEASVIETDDNRTQTVFVNRVDIDICRNFSMEAEPAEMEDCNANIPCPVRFSPGAYGPCDRFFCQTRNVTCRVFDPSDPDEEWEPDDPNLCANEGQIPPSTVRSCNGGICDFGFWTITETEPCSAVCGVGTQSRTVVCTTDRDPTSPRIDDGFCNVARRPPLSIPCLIRNCPGVCSSEPFMCSLIARRRMCKSPAFASITTSCCRSCPLQATPIPPLPLPRIP